MLSYYGLSDKYNVIKEWYDGYHFGDTDVYCPWDVVSYVSRLQAKRTLSPQDYWSNTSSNDVVKKLLEYATPTTRDEIERLIAGESIRKAETWKQDAWKRWNKLKGMGMGSSRIWMECEELSNAALPVM